MKATNVQNKLPAVLLGALAGILVFLWVYGTAPLHTGWDAWVYAGYDEWDVQQHYAGWLLFRNSHWGFPLGLADTIAAPDGTLISFTDSLPWVSIFLKLLRGILPSTFQWFGWYILLCFALQGAAGALLTRRRAGLAFAALGGAMFACLPTLWERAFRHTALASHWLYLFALYFYLEYRHKLRQGNVRFPWGFSLLAFLSVGIHPYFLPLVMICTLLAAVDHIRLRRELLRGIMIFLSGVGSALVGGVLCGAVGGGVSASRGGYGAISMNLNAIFNPYSQGHYLWSRLLPVLPQQPSQYDGFNYLGLGVLLLAAVSLVYALTHMFSAGNWWRRNGPLFAACVFLTAFAVSNGIYWGTEGFTIPLPAWLTELCGIFRSSGRMFYLVGACILLFGLYTLAEALHRPGIACTALAVFLAVQMWDLSGAAAQKRTSFAELFATAPVELAPLTQAGGLGEAASRLAATSPLREDRVRKLAVLAGQQGMSINFSVAVSGEYPSAQASMEQAAALLKEGGFDPGTVYVTTDFEEYESWQQIFGNNGSVMLFVVDSCYFLVPMGG